MPWIIRFKPRGEKQYKTWPHVHKNKYTANRRMKKLKKQGYDARVVTRVVKR